MEILTAIIALTTAMGNSTGTDEELVRATWQLVFETRVLWVMTILSGVAVAAVAAILGMNQRSLQTQIRKTQGMAEIRGLIEDQNIASFMKNIRDYKKTFDTRGEKAIYSSDDGLHHEQLTPAVIDQAGVVEGRFEDASRIVIKKLVDYRDFAGSFRTKFLEFWELLKDDIEYKRKVDKDSYRNFEKIVERLKGNTTHVDI
jgi:hypothetical protein